MPRRVAIILTTRGNYAKMKSVMRAVRARNDLELVTVVGGGLVHKRFGDYRPVIERDGFHVDAIIDFLVGDGATLASQTKSAGRAVHLVGRMLGAVTPDVVLIIADRWEALAMALAATTMNVAIAHLEGGEVSGSIDERLRHAVTKLAHLHLPANEEAATRIVRMGEAPERVVVVGTPSLDLLTETDLTDRALLAEAPDGQGDEIDFTKDYIVVSQHSVVTEEAEAEGQMIATMSAAASAQLPVVWMLPNMDAGADGVIRAMKRLHAQGFDQPVRVYPSMTFDKYAVLLANARCLLGNSSSGIREAAFLGTPVVNVGSRQAGRARGRNVIDVSYEQDAISIALAQQIAHGRYPSEPIYGDGQAGPRIADAIARMPLGLDKMITY